MLEKTVGYIGWRVSAALLLAISLSVQPVSAETPPDARELLKGWLQTVKRDGPQWRSMLADGRARADFCVNCHGEDGNSRMPLVPNLAGQNPYYLLEQNERFADGRRKDFIMSPLAKQFSALDSAMVSLYFASMPPRRHEADSGLLAQGAALYGQFCIACHGQGAQGNEQYARLAGQHPEYLTRRLTAFRELTGTSVTAMTPIARALNGKQIEQLAAYLSSLP